MVLIEAPHKVFQVGRHDRVDNRGKKMANRPFSESALRSNPTRKLGKGGIHGFELLYDMRDFLHLWSSL